MLGQQLHADNATGSADPELAFGGVGVIGEEFAEDAKPVAAFLGFRAVGVEDAQAKIGVVGIDEDEDSIRADAGVAIADFAYAGGGQLETEFAAVDHEVIIAKAVGFHEVKSHTATSKLLWFTMRTPRHGNALAAVMVPRVEKRAIGDDRTLQAEAAVSAALGEFAQNV